MSEDKIKARECRFAVHIPTKTRDIPDYHLVKEVVHYESGRTERRIQMVKNFQRPFAVTKQNYQDHQDKKEYEQLDKLNQFTCTQSDLRFQVAKALGNPGNPLPLNKLSASPYLYGSDVPSVSWIKHKYREKWPDANTGYLSAHLDIETDVIDGHKEPIMITIVMPGKMFFGATFAAFRGHTNIEEQYRATVKKYIQPYVDKYKLEIETCFTETPAEFLSKGISRLHEWLPDFVGVWNIGFDVPEILKCLEKYNIDPKDVFSDPSLPPELRFCKFKKGSTKMVTASGQHKPKNPSQQWHSLLCPAGFWFIDQMSGYRFVRQGGQEKPFYKLDYILQEELGERKLSFKEADNYHGLEEHKFMQKYYPFEYAVYNNFDAIGLMLLELQTKDLAFSIPVRTNISCFSRFDSQGKRFSDRFSFFLLTQGCMSGTVPPRDDSNQGDVDYEMIASDDDEENPSDGVMEELDELGLIMRDKNEVLGLRGWIVTLKSYLSSLGLALLKESKNLLTQFRAMVYDSDAVSAYPSAAAVANVSKATTFTEIIDFEGIDEIVYRAQNINLLQGHVNDLEYCNKMFKLPTLTESLKLFSE